MTNPVTLLPSGPTQPTNPTSSKRKKNPSPDANANTGNSACGPFSKKKTKTAVDTTSPFVTNCPPDDPDFLTYEVPVFSSKCCESIGKLLDARSKLDDCKCDPIIVAMLNEGRVRKTTIRVEYASLGDFVNVDSDLTKPRMETCLFRAMKGYNSGEVTPLCEDSEGIGHPNWKLPAVYVRLVLGIHLGNVCL